MGGIEREVVKELGRGGQWGILVGHGGVNAFVKILLLKYICLVFHVENGQNVCILIIFSFINIV